MKERIGGFKFRQLSTIGLFVLPLLIYACGVAPTPVPTVPTESPGQIVANLVETNLSIAGRGEQFLENCWMSLKPSAMLQEYPDGPPVKNIIPPGQHMVGINPGYKEFGGKPDNKYLFFIYEGDLYFVHKDSADLQSTTLPNDPKDCELPKQAVMIKPHSCTGPSCYWGDFSDGELPGPVGIGYILENLPNK